MKYVVKKSNGKYEVEQQNQAVGYDTLEGAQVVADYMNTEIFMEITALGKGSNRLGKEAVLKNRAEINEQIKKRWKLKEKK